MPMVYLCESHSVLKKVNDFFSCMNKTSFIPSKMCYPSGIPSLDTKYNFECRSSHSCSIFSIANTSIDYITVKGII